MKRSLAFHAPALDFSPVMNFWGIQLIAYRLLFQQGILRKFEFFPIKCRIQRAAELFAEIREELLDTGDKNHDNTGTLLVNNPALPPIKSKVHPLPQS